MTEVKRTRQEENWDAAHDLADMIVDCAYKMAIMHFVLKRTQSEVRINDLINEAKEKAAPKAEKTIDTVLGLLNGLGVDLYEH